MALVNGINYSWGNITILLFGVPVITSQKIDWKVSQEKSNTHGLGFDVISRGYGNISYEGSIDMLQDDWQKICFAAPNKNPLQIPPFQIRIVVGGARLLAVTTKLLFTEFTENPFTASQGDTKLMVSIPFIFAGIE